jgi:anti-anti-sigma factor
MNELGRVEARDLGAARLICVSGEIDLSNAPDVLERIGLAIPPEAHVVVLDLSDTAYLDSAGVAMIFRLAERLSNCRQRLRLVVPREAAIRAVVDLTAMRRVMAVDDAVTDVTSPQSG